MFLLLSACAPHARRDQTLFPRSGHDKFPLVKLHSLLVVGVQQGRAFRGDPLSGLIYPNCPQAERVLKRQMGAEEVEFANQGSPHFPKGRPTCPQLLIIADWPRVRLGRALTRWGPGTDSRVPSWSIGADGRRGLVLPTLMQAARPTALLEIWRAKHDVLVGRSRVLAMPGVR